MKSQDDIARQLDELRRQGAQVEEEIEHSTEILQSIDEKLADFKRRQQRRLVQDERVSEEVAKRVGTALQNQAPDTSDGQ